MAADSASALALELYFDEGDDRFLAEVLRSTQAKALGALAGKWLADRRPQLRRMLLDYVDDGCERPQHQALVKRLYKAAEAARDDELLAHFLVAFDRLARRKLETRTRWDWTEQATTTVETIRIDPAIPRGRAPTARMAPVNGRAPEPPVITTRDPYTGRAKKKKLEHLDTFTFRTRRYLQRRAWRYFRELGKKSPRGYRDAILTALLLYKDEHLTTSMELLDSWGLLSALYHHSPVIVMERAGFGVAEGAALAGLTAAPSFPEAWREAPEPLLDLVVRGRSRLVRLFAITMLRREHASFLGGVELTQLRRVLTSPHEEVQLFAAELLRTARGVEVLPVERWLELLRIGSVVALPILCELFAKAVLPERVSTEACLELACSPAAPVARLGFSWLRARPVTTQVELARLLRLKDAEAEVVRREAVTWLVGLLRGSPFTRASDARELVDGRHLDVRRAAAEWVFRDPRFAGDVLLWGAMCETPYDDVRAALLLHLEAVRSAAAAPRPGSAELTRATALDAGALRQVWASVLLAVHRGNRAKALASRQIAERVAAHPGEADVLLPLLGISLGSLRAPERRNALAAIGRAAHHAFELRSAIGRHLPGLTLFPERLAAGQGEEASR